jgi:hypothetical protein
MTAHDIGTLVRGLIEAAKGRRRQPSERNLTIYEQVRVTGDDPWEVAALHGISRRRVSAICQQVDRWFGEQEPWRLGDLQGAAARRAEFLVGKRRLAYLYHWALRGLKASGQQLVEGHTIMKDGEPTVRKQVQRDQSFNVQWLKVARKAAEKLLDLGQEDQSEEVAPPPRVARGEAVLRAASCLRRAIRQEAHQAGPEGIGKLVEQVVLACVGERPAHLSPESSPLPAIPGGAAEAAGAASERGGQAHFAPRTLQNEPVPADGAQRICTNYSADRAGNSPESVEARETGGGASDAAGVSCGAAGQRELQPGTGETDAEKNGCGIGSREAVSGRQNEARRGRRLRRSEALAPGEM